MRSGPRARDAEAGSAFRGRPASGARRGAACAEMPPGARRTLSSPVSRFFRRKVSTHVPKHFSTMKYIVCMLSADGVRGAGETCGASEGASGPGREGRLRPRLDPVAAAQ